MMTPRREHWPLTWTVEIQADQSLTTIFDVAELRATADTDRVAAGLPPVTWVGRTDEDPTFVAGRTLIRAIHCTQLRQALAELYDANGLGPLPDFTGGPIVPGTRPIKVSDPLDLRGWIEQYEALRPDLAARVVRRYGDYSVLGISDEHGRDRLTELWDGAGFSRYFYNAAGQLTRELRVLDSQEYWTEYEYDEQGRVSRLTYPDGERVSYRYTRVCQSLGYA